MCPFPVRSPIELLRGFSWQSFGPVCVQKDSSLHLGVKTLRICLEDPPTCLNRDNHRPAGRASLRHPIVQTLDQWFRNVDLIPITYAFRPRLRGRLTLSGLALLRKPWASGGEVSRLSYRYSSWHNRFHVVQRTLRSAFVLQWNAPLPNARSEDRASP